MSWGIEPEDIFLVKYYCPHNITMKYFTTKKIFFIPSYGIDVKETEKIDRFLELLDKSGVFIIFDEEKKNSSQGGRPTFNKYNMFAMILYCFAFSKASLRDIEDLCKFDLRIIYIMENETPCYVTISNFINEYIVPNRDFIFSTITKSIFNECNIAMDTAFVDGSKFEANSNKYKFVWKPTTYHIKLSDKIRKLLNAYDLGRGIPNDGIIDSRLIANKLVEFSALLDKESDKKVRKDFDSLSEYLNKSLEYEEKERICGPNRNSYYKTDHDATAMCLKNDYYSGLGSNMHAAYNCQLMVIHGFITDYFVSQSRSDINDFIPLIDKHYEMYRSYPENVTADSGYGSLDNYEYMNNRGITNYVKHQSWQGNVSGKNPLCYEINDDDTITCLNGNIGYQTTIIGRHPKKANAVFYRIDGCNTCPFSTYCKRFMKDKTQDYKVFEVVVQLSKYIKQSEENLLSPKGIEMRVNRSIQVEGAYGVIKQDFMYERFRRISINKVTAEFMLVCLGFNIRKLFRFFNGKSRFDYWTAPSNLKAETKKKPSAKRLTNKVNKKSNKSVNEVAKKHKYK